MKHINYDTFHNSLINKSKIVSIQYMKNKMNIIQKILCKLGINMYIYRYYIYPYLSYIVYHESPFIPLERYIFKNHNYSTLDIHINFNNIYIYINPFKHNNIYYIQVTDQNKNILISQYYDKINDIWNIIYHLYCKSNHISHNYLKLTDRSVIHMINQIETPK